ncbi:hypothetical protein PF010_g204 [Phytophthora fragariae]|uniref:Uncharacterized protein n=1 Tax=Phytophthora fragariae TaxID=53985 RepID=A0A6G0M459_9STRA|nr:hypothetical protein PF010_g204 [Phytophthora fragariae]
MVALRARVRDAEARMENLQNVRRDLDFLRDRVWNLPRQLDEEAERLRTRCSRGEENDASVRQVLERHLDWIRTLYDRVGTLEAQEARRVAARAPAPAPAPLPSEKLVRMMANAFQQYSATQSAPQAQQPRRVIGLEQANVERQMRGHGRWQVQRVGVAVDPYDRERPHKARSQLCAAHSGDRLSRKILSV